MAFKRQREDTNSSEIIKKVEATKTIVVNGKTYLKTYNSKGDSISCVEVE